jgi:hypothetical protein
LVGRIVVKPVFIGLVAPVFLVVGLFRRSAALSGGIFLKSRTALAV